MFEDRDELRKHKTNALRAKGQWRESGFSFQLELTDETSRGDQTHEFGDFERGRWGRGLGGKVVHASELSFRRCPRRC